MCCVRIVNFRIFNFIS